MAILAATAVLSLGACNRPTAICTLEFRYGLAVRLSDSLSGGPLPVDAMVYARDGAYVDSARASAFTPPNQNAVGLAGERPGTYEITVRAAGYDDWQRSSVQVVRGACHVEQVLVTARLAQ